MDEQTFRPEDAPPALETSSYAGYDESVLGVECAWPCAERELPATLH
ncbi:MAG: hypothetical protein AB7S87_09970 [Burkholderiales bacterium]